MNQNQEISYYYYKGNKINAENQTISLGWKYQIDAHIYEFKLLKKIGVLK